MHRDTRFPAIQATDRNSGVTNHLSPGAQLPAHRFAGFWQHTDIHALVHIYNKREIHNGIREFFTEHCDQQPWHKPSFRTNVSYEIMVLIINDIMN